MSSWQRNKKYSCRKCGKKLRHKPKHGMCQKHYREYLYNKYWSVFSCKYCGKKFERRIKLEGRHRGEYCSVQCAAHSPSHGYGKNLELKGKFINMHGYEVVTVNGKLCLAHRIIMERRLKRKLKSNEIIHHINGTRNDNRICNLAIVTRASHERGTLSKIQARRIRYLEHKIKRMNNGLHN
jgi:HNH endonuclease